MQWFYFQSYSLVNIEYVKNQKVDAVQQKRIHVLVPWWCWMAELLLDLSKIFGKNAILRTSSNRAVPFSPRRRHPRCWTWWCFGSLALILSLDWLLPSAVVSSVPLSAAWSAAFAPSDERPPAGQTKKNTLTLGWLFVSEMADTRPEREIFQGNNILGALRNRELQFYLFFLNGIFKNIMIDNDIVTTLNPYKVMQCQQHMLSCKHMFMYRFDLRGVWLSSSQHCPLWPHSLFLSFCALQRATDYLSPCSEKEEVTTWSPHVAVHHYPCFACLKSKLVGNTQKLSNLPSPQNTLPEWFELFVGGRQICQIWTLIICLLQLVLQVLLCLIVTTSRWV